MRTLIRMSVLIMVLLANVSVAQNRQNASSRKYDTRTVQRIEGTIEAVEKVSNGKKMNTGIHLDVRTSSGNVAVHLGPQWYIEQQSLTLDKGDEITVEGSKVSIDGKTAIIAREVKKGNATLKLRDEDGTPVWSGGKRR